MVALAHADKGVADVGIERFGQVSTQPNRVGAAVRGSFKTAFDEAGSPIIGVFAAKVHAGPLGDGGFGLLAEEGKTGEARGGGGDVGVGLDRVEPFGVLGKGEV